MLLSPSVRVVAAAACKAAVAVAVVGAVHCGGVVEDKLTVAGHTVDVCSPSLLELGKIFPHVVEVVALVVDLKQALHILKGAFVGLVSIQIEQGSRCCWSPSNCYIQYC